MKSLKRIALLFKKKKIKKSKEVIVFGDPGRGKVFSGIISEVYEKDEKRAKENN